MLEEALGKLRTEPDLFLFDGSGYVHPRRMGLGGLLKDAPDGPPRGGAAGEGGVPPLLDKAEVVGGALSTRTRANPVFVSVGHLIDLASAVAVTLLCAPRFRLPEPIRLAHVAAGEIPT